MKPIKILTITAGLSEPSSTALLGEQLSEATEQNLGAFGISVEVTPIHLRSLAKDITNHYLTGFPMGELATALDALTEADAVITVTPTFKATYTGLFKSFWDLVDDEAMVGKPVLVAATGGTARHSLMIDTALRPLFGYFKAHVVPTGVFAATDDFGSDTSLQGRIDRAGAELAQMLAWKLGSQVALTKEGTSEVETAPIDPASEETFDDLDGVNSGDFFGIAVEKQPRQEHKHKSPGLKELKVTPFEQLLKNL